MLKKLGPFGAAGAVLVLIGVAAIAVENLIIAAGLALVIAGLGLLAKAGIDAVMGLFGMV